MRPSTNYQINHADAAPHIATLNLIKQTKNSIKVTEEENQYYPSTFHISVPCLPKKSQKTSLDDD